MSRVWYEPGRQQATTGSAIQPVVGKSHEGVAKNVSTTGTTGSARTYRARVRFRRIGGCVYYMVGRALSVLSLLSRRKSRCRLAVFRQQARIGSLLSPVVGGTTTTKSHAHVLPPRHETALTTAMPDTTNDSMTEQTLPEPPLSPAETKGRLPFLDLRGENRVVL